LQRVPMNESSFNSTNDLYRRMVEEIQDYAIYLMDARGYIMNWNKGAQQIKQYTEGDIVGKHFSMFYTAEDREHMLPHRLLERARETGRAELEGWRLKKDGTRFWASVTITALYDDKGNVECFCKVTRDLSAKKQAEDNLRSSEERYHRMVAEVQDYAIILLDANGTIENWNIGAEKIKGYTADEIVGKSFETFYAKEDRETGLPHHLLNLARETGKASHEGWRVRKDGSRFWSSVTITALHNNDNEIIGYSKVTRDLTQKKMAEDRLAAYNAELIRQNGELEQFAYVASHDLQEPLRKIQTFAGLIRENADDKAFAEKYFGKIEMSARRMAELIRSLLSYSRLSQSGADVYHEQVPLDEVLNGVLQDLELLIAEKDAHISSDTLPTIRGNRTQLGQLFFNLIGNSLKFSDGAPAITIRAEVVNRDDIPHAPASLTSERYHSLRFADNGIGFEDEYSVRIFSLFQRLHGRQDYDGTGIGLALCKKIVDNHRGYIYAKGEPGKGATFFIYLPV
jgi:PAS domain S-box-containing protein